MRPTHASPDKRTKPESAGCSASCAPQKNAFSLKYICTSSDSSCRVKMPSRKSVNRLPMPMALSKGMRRPVSLGQAGQHVQVSKGVRRPVSSGQAGRHVQVSKGMRRPVSLGQTGRHVQSNNKAGQVKLRVELAGVNGNLG